MHLLFAVLMLAASPAKSPAKPVATLSPAAAAKAPAFEQVPGFKGVAQISTGFNRACARFQSGRVECWGADPSQRKRVAGLDDAIQVSVSDDFACALTNDLSVKCWGANGSGQLGDGTTTDREEPVKVDGVSNATAIGVGLAHACALLEDGTARCWGANGSGEVGDGSTQTPRPNAVAVRGLGKTTQMALARANRTSCARLVSGEVRCWGKIGHEDFSTPAAVEGLEHVAQIAVALDTFCARMDDATLRCWGGNSAGQVGDGRTKDVATPVPVDGVENVVDVVPGADHTCAQVRDGSLRCWGGVAQTTEGPGGVSAPPTFAGDRITSLKLPAKRRVQRFALMQTPSSELSLYAVADDGTLWWVAAPERRLAGRWLGLDEGGPFTMLAFRSTPNGFGSEYEATGTSPAPGCKAPRCAAKAGESGQYSVRGQVLTLSSKDRTVADDFRFDLTTSTLALSVANFSQPFRFIRACENADVCETFDLSRPSGKGAWKCEQQRCFWVGAEAQKKKAPKAKATSKKKTAP